MTTLALVSSSPMTMTSLEIADLTVKQHSNVLRDIRSMLVEVHGLKDDSELNHKEIQGVKIDRDNRNYISLIRLDKDHTLTLLTGYDAKSRFKVMQRWQELEQGAALPKVSDPTLAALVQTVVELDHVKQQQAALASQQAALSRQTEILENRVQNVELQHRNGVPDGYLSKKEAHHLYGVGLSEEIFECLLVKIGVSSKRYMHFAEGYKTPSTAYLEAEIQPAVEMFLEDSVQCSAVFCMSPMLDGKRFRYVKEPFIKEDAA